MAIHSFEWDEIKDRTNRLKHGISFHEAQQAFYDKDRIILKDYEHSQGEQRYYCFGKVTEKVMTVCFTYRDQKIRIILKTAVGGVARGAKEN